MIDTGDLVEHILNGEYRYRGFVVRVYRDENLAKKIKVMIETKELPLNELVR